MFRRKVYDALAAWKKEAAGGKAILLEGARRVGKSTVAEAFARNEYRSHILIDFSIAPDPVKGYFRDYIADLDTFFMMLSTLYGVRLYPRETLIVFDEVQTFPKAREAIKHLVKDGRYDYLETGSLISIRENVKDILIPSEERKIKMHPLDFEEFLQAMGEEELPDYIRRCFTERMPLDRGLHNKAMLLFKQYMLVGGMPRVVALFLEHRQLFDAADREKRDILNLYREDIMKIGLRYRNKVTALFDQIPGLLSKHEKRVVYNRIVEGSKADQYAETMFWLANSMICNECFNCADPQVGLSMNEERTYMKCYMGDTGLLVSHAFDENELLSGEVYTQILNDKLSLNKGMLYENVIAQMLVASGHRLFFHTRYNEEKHRNDIEIDFLLSGGGGSGQRIFPVEVKSGRNYSTASLLKFREKYRQRIGECYIVHPRNLALKDGILCIPPYMAFCL